ncbi:hypothetical protein O6H91_Y395800 [Diphasiastrum complanatum]|nr:hypothetical protein O6H91_Y395800 [Diphasiastrum complanatum]
MDILDFISDWGLPQLKSWNVSDDMIPSPFEERHAEYYNPNSKRRKLNPADSLQEEAWLNWLDMSCSSPETENEPLLEETKYGLPSGTNQSEELNDEEKNTLNNLMKYLLDPEEKVCKETNVFSDETLGDHILVDRPTSDHEMQLHDIMKCLLEPHAKDSQEVDVSSSKSSEKQSLSSSATSAELQIEDPQTPETSSGNTEGRGSDQQLEEFSDSDSEEVMILDSEDSNKQPERLQRVGSSDADGAVTAKDNKWEELQISKGSHPASPASSEETEFFRCYSPQTEEEYNAVSLVHLLTACAEAVTSGNQDLAAVILAKIEHLVSPKESAFQRVASYFYQSLQSVITQELPADDNITPSAETITGAFQLLHEVSPYNKFAHLTANQAIMEAVEDETVVHIIDFDIMEGLQWPPLIEALATRSNEVSFLQITAVQLEGAPNTLSSSLELTGRRLTEFADSLQIPFSFETVVLDEETACLQLDGADQGGALIANCMLQLPHMTSRNPKSIFSFISAISKMEIKLVTISDDALKCRSTDFTERFFEILHHSCALFDSVEASLSMHNLARAMIETTFLAPRIWSTVASICQQQEKDQEVGRARSTHIMQELGFEPLSISHYNQIQAELLLAFFKEGYRIEDEGDELAICWRDRPLVAVSTWKCSASPNDLSTYI